MQILIVAAVSAAAITATTSMTVTVAQTPGRSESVLVKAVIDGGTIHVQTYGHVRLLGIDAPTLGRGSGRPAPFGKDARDRLASLVLHRWVRLETDGPRPDVRAHRGAYVMTEDGQCVNIVLVREGLARVSSRPLARMPELKRAEAEARAAHRGIWSTSGTSRRIPPASYTRHAGAGRSKAPRAQRKHHRDSRRVRRASQDPRAQQAVLPRQPPADRR